MTLPKRAQTAMDDAAGEHHFGSLLAAWATHHKPKTGNQLIASLAAIALGLALISYGLPTHSDLATRSGGGLFAIGLIFLLHALLASRRRKRWLAVYQQGVVEHLDNRRTDSFDLRTARLLAHQDATKVSLRLRLTNDEHVDLCVGDHGAEIMATLVAAATAAKLEPTLKKLRRGKSIHFGTVTVSARTFTHRQRAHRWDELTEFSIDDESTAHCTFADGHRATISLMTTPDSALLVQLIEHFIHQPRTPDS